uniref:Tafazzin family protein n=1 Tax=Riptortus pedestris TaxID=329032 RepID=R4WDP2_RIPPE|nr:taz protein [Riptortus pedestris]
MQTRGLSSLKYPSFDWVFFKLRKPPCGLFLWNIASNITLITVGMFSKFLIRILNRTNCYNEKTLHSAIYNKPADVPVITISNHHSCFDDPGIWGALNLKLLFSKRKMRWSLAAHDICFTNSFHSYFFMLGKCLPVVRGKGVYQEAIDFCIERLKYGDWVHIFPEGRVNLEKQFIRFKWGVGRLIYESPITPIIIPIWHIGMEDILPNKTPYIFRAGKLLTLNFGKPIDLSSVLLKLRSENVSPETARKVITDKLQEELFNLKIETEKLHYDKVKK